MNAGGAAAKAPPFRRSTFLRVSIRTWRKAGTYALSLLLVAVGLAVAWLLLKSALADGPRAQLRHPQTPMPVHIPPLQRIPPQEQAQHIPGLQGLNLQDPQLPQLRELHHQAQHLPREGGH